MRSALLCGLLLAAGAQAGCKKKERDPPPPPAPALTTVVPTQGPTAGGTVVTVTGTGLGTVDSVQFAGVAGTGLKDLVRRLHAIARAKKKPGKKAPAGSRTGTKARRTAEVEAS